MMNIIPLDMSIICNAFCKARLPGHEIDRIVDYKDSSHVVISCNGHFYSVRVIGTDGKSVAYTIRISCDKDSFIMRTFCNVPFGTKVHVPLK